MPAPSITDLEFRRLSDLALEELKKHLYATEDAGGFEVEEQAGALYVVFEEPPGKFVVSPNAPIHQIWVSALSTSFKLDYTPDGFRLPKTDESLISLLDRLIAEHTA